MTATNDRDDAAVATLIIGVTLAVVATLLPILQVTGNSGTLRFTAPAPGHYRLFVEAHDGQGHAAYANLPFRVAGAAQD